MVRLHNRQVKKPVKSVFLLHLTLVSIAAFQPFAHAQSVPDASIGVESIPRFEVAEICALIKMHALRNDLPPSFFARLIWKESRFDINAISPAGAQGIAQFMPATARRRNLVDPFDPRQAIAASAEFLAVLRAQFGNLGLASAAYNAGENRVDRWLVGASTLPLETENYVLDITGEPAENFADRTRQLTNKPLDDTRSFDKACQRLPVVSASLIPMAAAIRKPWAIQVAGNFKRSAATRAWERIKARNASLVADLPMSISRLRTPRGRQSIFAVRLGADTRTQAERLCTRLRANGTPCLVAKN